MSRVLNCLVKLSQNIACSPWKSFPWNGSDNIPALYVFLDIAKFWSAQLLVSAEYTTGNLYIKTYKQVDAMLRIKRTLVEGFLAVFVMRHFSPICIRSLSYIYCCSLHWVFWTSIWKEGWNLKSAQQNLIFWKPLRISAIQKPLKSKLKYMLSILYLPMRYVCPVWALALEIWVLKYFDQNEAGKKLYLQKSVYIYIYI